MSTASYRAHRVMHAKRWVCDVYSVDHKTLFGHVYAGDRGYETVGRDGISLGHFRSSEDAAEALAERFGRR
jgi:hypothetical protein